MPAFAILPLGLMRLQNWPPFFFFAEPTGKPRVTAAHNTSSTSLYLSWQPPEPDTIHGDFLGYRLTYRPRDVGEERAEVVELEDPKATVRKRERENNTLITYLFVDQMNQRLFKVFPKTYSTVYNCFSYRIKEPLPSLSLRFCCIQASLADFLLLDRPDFRSWKKGSKNLHIPPSSCSLTFAQKRRTKKKQILLFL